MFTHRPTLPILIGRARRLLAKAQERLDTGEVSSEASLLATLVASLSQFFDRLQEPSMQVPSIRKDDLLVREKIEEPFEQATEDLDLAYDQLTALHELNRQVFNTCQAEIAGLQEGLAELLRLGDQLRLWTSDSVSEFLWVGDTFNTLSQVDSAGSSVWIDTQGGTVCLRPTSQRSLTPYIQSAELDKEISAGGIPGNNLEVKEPGKQAFTGIRPEPGPVLWSDSQDTTIITQLFDGEPDTWFEWETYRVPNPQKVVKARTALVYDPQGKSYDRIPSLPNWICYLRWPGETAVDFGAKKGGYPLAKFVAPLTSNQNNTATESAGKLRLGILITLKEPRPVSWMQIDPLIRGNAYPQVEQILISNDGERWRKIVQEPVTLHPRMNQNLDLKKYGLTASNYNGLGVFPLPSTPVRFISIVLSQEHWYECPLGIAHQYHWKGPAGSARGRRNAAGRTWGTVPIIGSTATTPGVDVSDDPDTAKAIGKKIKKGKTKSKRAYDFFDLFQGDRQAIMLRDLLLEERLYAAAGQFLSLPWKLERPVRAAALQVTENIPEEWGATGPDGRPWVTYELSVDGNLWQEIVPQRTQLEDSVLTFEEPTDTLFFRAALTRPTDQEAGTPFLKAYALKLLPVS